MVNWQHATGASGENSEKQAVPNAPSLLLAQARCLLSFFLVLNFLSLYLSCRPGCAFPGHEARTEGVGREVPPWS